MTALQERMAQSGQLLLTFLGPGHSLAEQRNALIALAILAEQLAGVHCTLLLTEPIVAALVRLLRDDAASLTTLAALIAVEKFGISGALRWRHGRTCHSPQRAPSDGCWMLAARRCCTHSSASTAWARWPQPSPATTPSATRRLALWPCGCSTTCLRARDVTVMTACRYECAGRPFSEVPRDAGNVMLDRRDATKHLQVGPSGLEARNDAATFESVRATCCARGSGQWYYEAILLTAGVLQIGWATRQCRYWADDGQGIGCAHPHTAAPHPGSDDDHSFAYDGCRCLVWHEQQPRPAVKRSWRAGDVMGALLDLDAGRFSFTLNGANRTAPRPFTRRRAGNV